MKRLLSLTAAAAVVLLLLSLTHHHGRRRGATATQSRPIAAADAAEIARRYLGALLTGDLTTARAASTPLLAAQLAAQPPGFRTVDRPPRIDLLTLDQQPGSTDLAAEMHWPDGRIAAMRVQLDLLDGHWFVAGVQP